MNFVKRKLPVLLAFMVGVGLWAQFYVPTRWSQDALETFTTSWAVILTSAALILGILSALHHHWTKIRLRKPGFAYSIIMICCFSVMVIVGQFSIKWPGFSETGIKSGSFFDWIFLNIFVPLEATMFSLLAFFIASAAFRAFRARSFEATALLIAGCVVMLGRVYLGEVIGIPGTDYNLTNLSGWILNNPNAAAQRGILLGVLLSMFAISMRIIFGIERTYMGGGD